MAIEPENLKPDHMPIHRPRRLRRNAIIRHAVSDVRLATDDLIMPLFVSDADKTQPVQSLPGVSQLSIKDLLPAVRKLCDSGVRQFILFGVTDPIHKDPHGRYASDLDAPVNRACQMIRDAGLDVLIYADLCFCEYTDHGHCGVLSDPDPGWQVDNDRTLDILADTACVQAQCGADVIAPSGMMDGQVGAIRRALDQQSHQHVAIMSYSIKYASSLYGPFREAGGTHITTGDRRGYQMDFRRSREWQTELESDLAQGADIVMVKPAVTYLDIIGAAKSHCHVPLAAYHVSGEYAMICAAAERGWLDLKQTAMETTYAIKRAGADLIVSYFTPRLAEWLAESD